MDAREGKLESGKRLIVFVMLIWLESMSRVTGIIRQRERERERAGSGNLFNYPVFHQPICLVDCGRLC